MENQLICQYCGKPLKPHHGFCGYCRHPVLRKCPHCNEELEAGMVMCPNCGVDIQTTANSSQTTPGPVPIDTPTRECFDCGEKLELWREQCPKCGKPVHSVANVQEPDEQDFEDEVEEDGDLLFNKMKKLIAEKLEVDEDKIVMEADFRQDLGADSLDLYELMYAAEEKFEIPISDEVAIEFETVGDAYNYIKTQLPDTITNDFPDSEYLLDKPFLMPIHDVFTISGRGTVVTGEVERGIVRLHDEIELVGIGQTKKTTVMGIEMFNKLLDETMAGDNVGILLKNITKEEVERGQVLAQPGSITPHSKFKAQIYCLSKEEGGRHSPFFTGYRPQFYFRTTDITGTIKILGNKEMVMPGYNSQIIVELIHPIALEKGLRFAIREGGKTVASGQVIKIIE